MTGCGEKESSGKRVIEEIERALVGCVVARNGKKQRMRNEGCEMIIFQMYTENVNVNLHRDDFFLGNGKCEYVWE